MKKLWQIENSSRTIISNGELWKFHFREFYEYICLKKNYLLISISFENFMSINCLGKLCIFNFPSKSFWYDTKLFPFFSYSFPWKIIPRIRKIDQDQKYEILHSWIAMITKIESLFFVILFLSMIFSRLKIQTGNDND